jgi:hypothetical protein
MADDVASNLGDDRCISTVRSIQKVSAPDHVAAAAAAGRRGETIVIHIPPSFEIIVARCKTTILQRSIAGTTGVPTKWCHHHRTRIMIP